MRRIYPFYFVTRKRGRIKAYKGFIREEDPDKSNEDPMQGEIQNIFMRYEKLIFITLGIFFFALTGRGLGIAGDASRFYSAQLLDDGCTVLFTYAKTKFIEKSSGLFFGGTRYEYTEDRKIIALYHMISKTTEVIKKIDNEPGTRGRGNFTIRGTFDRKAILIRDSREQGDETLPGGWFVLDVDTKDLTEIPIEKELADLGMVKLRALKLGYSDGRLVLCAYSPNQVEKKSLGHVWLRSKNGQYQLLTEYGNYSGTNGDELLFYDHSLRTVRGYNLKTKEIRNVHNREYASLEFHVTRYGKPQRGRAIRADYRGSEELELSIEKDGKWQNQPFPIDMKPLR